MKKFIPIVIVGILVLSGLGAAAFTTNVSMKQAMNVKTESTSVLFSSQPILSEKDGFVEIQLDGATTRLLDTESTGITYLCEDLSDSFPVDRYPSSLHCEGYDVP